MQPLAEQPLGDGRQKAEPRRRFEHAAPERVGDDDVAFADRREQSGHAERGVDAQLHRVAKIIVEPAQDGVHPLQARRASSRYTRLVAHGEIVSFDQGKPELTREIGVLEIGLVE